MSIWSDMLAGMVGLVGAGGNPQAAAANAGQTVKSVAAANPLSGLEGVASVIGSIGVGITDGKMWRSLGWLLLGIMLLLAGLFFLVHGPRVIEQGVGTTVGAAVKAV